MMTATSVPTEAPARDPDEALLAVVRALRANGYAFTTVTPATHATVLARDPGLTARSLRDIFGWSRPFHESMVSAELFAHMREAGILRRTDEGWRSAVRVSSLGDDLFLHSAYPPNDENVIFFGPDTLRFVQVVEGHLSSRSRPIIRAVDIGTGTGAAGIVIAKRLPEAEVVLVDINPQALRLAELNARSAGTERIVLAQSDLLGAIDGSFDLIVSNPPFMIDRAGRTYRDGGGARGEGLSLAVVQAAVGRLAPGGSLVLFTGAVILNGDDPFRMAATAACTAAGLDWTYREYDPDAYGEELGGSAYAAADRIALVVLTATRRQEG